MFINILSKNYDDGNGNTIYNPLKNLKSKKKIAYFK